MTQAQWITERNAINAQRNEQVKLTLELRTLRDKLTKLKATNTADTIDSQDSNDSDVEFVHTGIIGFRDGHGS